MKYRIIPTQDRVLIKVLPEHPDKTPGGIYIPEAVKESPQEIGVVVDVGPGRYTEKGHFVTPTVSVGDKVLYNGMAGSKHNLDNPMGFEDHALIRDGDILAVLVDAGEGEVDVTAPGPDYGKTDAVADLDYE
jgi:chaperonin GroES